MLYLLDANVLITANARYYPLDQVPEFWEWLVSMGKAGKVRIPLEIFEEVTEGPNNGEKDPLYAWLHNEENKAALVLDESVDNALVQKAVDVGYAPDLTDDEIEEIGRDPFLIAYAMAKPAERCVVTVETSKPKAQRQNRKIPDVCSTLKVKSCDTFELNRALGFKTGWKAGISEGNSLILSR